MQNSAFRIAGAEVARRERLPYIASAMFGVTGGLIGYAQSSRVIGVMAGAAVMGGLMWFLKWREARAFREWAPTHSLQLGEAGLTVLDGATESHLPYSGVRKIVVVGPRAKPRRVTMVRDNGSSEILPPYAEMGRLITELELHLGPGKVTYRRL
jgi:hypothetical protein